MLDGKNTNEFDKFIKILPFEAFFSDSWLHLCKADTVGQNFTPQFFPNPNSSKFCAIQ